MTDLQDRIANLKDELRMAIDDREKAAKYGLAVLEEKQATQLHCEQLEIQLESLQKELQMTKAMLSDMSSGLKRANELGANLEESSLADETILRNNLRDLQLEFSLLKKKYEESEIDKYASENKCKEISSNFLELVSKNQEMKLELRETLERENRLLTEFSELEEDNITFQKQISILKQTQIEYESLKCTNRQLLIKVDEYKCELESVVKLKEMVEHELEDTVEMLRHEREEKIQLKKDLDERISDDSVKALQAIASLGVNGLHDSETFGTYDSQLHECHDGPTLRRIEADFAVTSLGDRPRIEDSSFSSPIVSDLFSEVHQGEIRRLEHSVDKLTTEKHMLERSLHEANEKIDNMRLEIVEADRQINLFKETINDKQSDQILIDNSTELKYEDLKFLKCELPTYILALEEVSRLRLQNKCVDLKNKEIECQELFINGSIVNLESLVKNLSSVHSILSIIIEQPIKVFNIINKDLNQIERFEHLSDLATNISSHIFSLVSKVDLKCKLLLEDVSIKYSGQKENVSELREQVVKLRAMMATKRDQISTLRNVLKSNKLTAETALSSLKIHFESALDTANRELQRMHSEAVLLKEERASYVTSRAAADQRCDELSTRLDEQKLSMTQANEERKTLKSLLKMAIQQKMQLASKLENLENDRQERRNRFVAKNVITMQRDPGFIQVMRPAYFIQPVQHVPQVTRQYRRDY